MTFKKLKLSAVLLIGIGLTGIQAQEIITSTGGDASGSGGTSSYTVGQVVYCTHAGNHGSVAQGVQQAYEISVVSGIENAKEINLECSVYPNPTTDILTLKVKNYGNENLSYQLFDINGKLFENKKLTGNETTVQMEDLITAIYFLKVTDHHKEIKTFRIIKN